MKQTSKTKIQERPGTAKRPSSVKRPSSACPTSINIQKREKLKKLLIEKFTKKFHVSEAKLIENEVSVFIQKSNLTENDLKSFEGKLKNMIEGLNEKDKIKKQLEQVNAENANKLPPNEVKNNNYFQKHKDKDNDDTKSVCSRMSDISNSVYNKNAPGLKYEEITNFELRKLLQSERKPVVREQASNEDEWTAIAKNKKQLWEDAKKGTKEIEKINKIKTRETYDSQIKEKEQKKQVDQKTDFHYHKDLMCHVDKLTFEERKKLQEMKDKRMNERQLRDMQIQDNISRKKNDFLSNREFDNTISNYKLNLL
jgi:hypothetical protein